MNKKSKNYWLNRAIIKIGLFLMTACIFALAGAIIKNTESESGTFLALLFMWIRAETHSCNRKL